MAKYKIGYTTGVFDMFHVGHLNVIKNAKKHCNFLIVGVTTDALCFQRKKKWPIFSQKERMAIVGALKYVDLVILQTDMDKARIVKKYHCDAVFVGSDWKGTPSWKQYGKDFKKFGCTVVYLKHTDGISSTELRDKIVKL